MRIGILADTHSQLARVTDAVERLERSGARALFHCGDLLDVEVAIRCLELPAYFVFGNNDRDRKRIAEAIFRRGGTLLGENGEGGEVELGGKRIAMTHGHLKTEVRRLLAGRPDYLLVGHSHKKSDSRAGSTRIINPGALHRAIPWSVALLDLGTDHLEFLELPHER
jgi:putative phosphoesterase